MVERCWKVGVGAHSGSVNASDEDRVALQIATGESLNDAVDGKLGH